MRSWKSRGDVGRARGGTVDVLVAEHLAAHGHAVVVRRGRSQVLSRCSSDGGVEGASGCSALARWEASSMHHQVGAGDRGGHLLARVREEPPGPRRRRRPGRARRSRAARPAGRSRPAPRSTAAYPSGSVPVSIAMCRSTTVGLRGPEPVGEPAPPGRLGQRAHARRRAPSAARSCHVAGSAEAPGPCSRAPPTDSRSACDSGELLADRAAEREPDEREPVDAQRVDQREHVRRPAPSTV